MVETTVQTQKCDRQVTGLGPLSALGTAPAPPRTSPCQVTRPSQLPGAFAPRGAPGVSLAAPCGGFAETKATGRCGQRDRAGEVGGRKGATGGGNKEAKKDEKSKES